MWNSQLHIILAFTATLLVNIDQKWMCKFSCRGMSHDSLDDEFVQQNILLIKIWHANYHNQTMGLATKVIYSPNLTKGIWWVDFDIWASWYHTYRSIIVIIMYMAFGSRWYRATLIWYEELDQIWTRVHTIQRDRSNPYPLAVECCCTWYLLWFLDKFHSSY